ncbi:probable ergosterol biosynthetic protein 28 [Anneissia japonica]|uniref:probable ergosterol biosynthetic protein 28 n=1 Tax=Anneissia japonica TaxID=1529436 RepID=UPI0014255B65|nr:probable ergosterol biosynthetic protein 28 [Anneissia japonica]XP_033118934.1 probable ergosterol biosynthetic protein 28 [Anneissia japonica]
MLPGTSLQSFLRSWIGVVGFMALGNTVQCFISGNGTTERLYAGSEDQVTSLAVRLFGVWTFLAAVLRITCALYIHNNQVYFLTLGSFILVFVHFISELLIFKSAVFSVEIISPLAISGTSIILMIVGRWFLEPHKVKRH